MIVSGDERRMGQLCWEAGRGKDACWGGWRTCCRSASSRREQNAGLLISQAHQRQSHFLSAESANTYIYLIPLVLRTLYIVSHSSWFSNNTLSLKFFPLISSRWRTQGSERLHKLASAGGGISTQVYSQSLSPLHVTIDTCFVEGSEAHGGSRGDLATALYNCSHRVPSSWNPLSASCHLGLSIPSDDAPEPRLHRTGLLCDSPAGLFLSRSVPCRAEAPGEGLTPHFIRPFNFHLLPQWDIVYLFLMYFFSLFDLPEQPLQFRFLPGHDEIPSMFSTPSQVSRCISFKNSSPSEEMILVWAMLESWRSQTHHG